MPVIALVDVSGFTLRTVMPPGDVTVLETKAPGWLLSSLQTETAYLYSRLRKRYAVPFDAANPPEVARRWLVQLVTSNAYRKRGANPQDPQLELVEKDRDRALAEIKEAADSNEGLFDLPLHAETAGTGITNGGPLGYSEASPYDWIDVQATSVRGGGT